MNNFLRTYVYITTLIIIQTHGHLLLAANLKEFKSIAKQYVPENLANQLADLASNPNVKYRQEQESEDESESYSESVTDDDDDGGAARTGPAEKVREVHLAKVNFEELVQKVKERLENDYAKSQKKVEVKPKGAIFAQKSYIQEQHFPLVSRFVNDKREKTTKSYNNPNLEGVEVPLNKSPVQDEGMTFAKIELKDKDSYEDYVTPAKEKNIFEGAVDKFDDIQTTTLKQVPEYTNQEMEYADEDKTEELKAKSEELKAKTEDLWYDDKQTTVTTTLDYKGIPTMKRKTTKGAKGTMIPKRDFYKMSSPNYFAKVPIVAEKYDFNEPIPENDREPEEFKPVRGFPVNINGKIKLTDK